MATMNTKNAGDPACDQCRARKIKCGRERPVCYHCERSGVNCEFSGKGRKPDQLVGLSTGLSNIEERLEKIEGFMSTLSRDVQRIKLSSQSPGSCSQLSDGSGDTHTNPSTDASRDERIEGVTSGKILYDASGHERYCTPTSLPFLILEMTEFLNARALAVQALSEVPSPKEQMTPMMDYSTYVTPQDQIDLSHDGLDLVLPPRIVLDAMVGPFFSKIHGLLPIFNKANFDENLEILYSGRSTGSDRAWTLCFNNVILLTLIPKTAQSQNLNTHMDTDLIEAFIGNFRRGLQYLAKLLAPKLCNIQAMITMILVAQENGQSSLSNFLISLACNSARAMGLHRQSTYSQNLDPQQLEERDYCFWSLYILDTTTCFTTDKPKHIPMADYDVELPQCNRADIVNTTFVARIRLMQEQEEIFTKLYSVEAGRWSQSRRQQQSSNLLESLQRLERTFSDLYIKIPNDEHQDFLPQIELEFAFRTSRILVHRSRTRDAISEDILQDSIKCLDIFLRLQNDKSHIGAYSVLLRIFETHSFIAFFCLFSYVANKPSATKELKKLKEVTEALRYLQNHNIPSMRFSSLLMVCSLVDRAFPASSKSEDGQDHSIFGDFSAVGSLIVDEFPYDSFTQNIELGDLSVFPIDDDLHRRMILNSTIYESLGSDLQL